MKLKRRNSIFTGLIALLPFKWLRRKVKTVEYGIIGKIHFMLDELKRDGKTVHSIRLHPDTFKELCNEMDAAKMFLMPYSKMKLHSGLHPNEWSRCRIIGGVPVCLAISPERKPGEVHAEYSLP